MRAVAVEDVRAEFAFDNRIAYHITLSCGCSYWEYRLIGEPPPRKGRLATCGVVHADRLRTTDAL